MWLVVLLACGPPPPPVAAHPSDPPAAAPSEPATRVRVESGVYRLDEREVWLGGFSLDAVAGPEDACTPAPTAEERRVAARDPAFVPSDGFEALWHSPLDACGIQSAVVEAEGMDGWQWFGGWGERLGEAEVVSGEGDAREGVIRVHSVAYYFFGDDAKPSPRRSRCIERDAPAWRRAWTLEPADVQAARDGEIVHSVPKGATLQVWHIADDWAWVDAPKFVEDRSGDEPVTRGCFVPGWVPTKALRISEQLSSEPPAIAP